MLFKTETAQALYKKQSAHEHCEMEDVQVHNPQTTDGSQTLNAKDNIKNVANFNQLGN